MKYLIIDDTPEHLKRVANALRANGNQVVFARDLEIAWSYLEQGDRFNLIAIDLALDYFVEEFVEEFNDIKSRLTASNGADLPMSGQALGLRLWRKRKSLQQSYCYISNHPSVWVGKLDTQDPEFNGARANEIQMLLIDKSDLWANNVREKFGNALDHWNKEKWLD